MPKLHTYVAELSGFTPPDGTRCARETWTVRAKSLKDARRRLKLAAGVDEVCPIAKVQDHAMRHWRAG